MGFSVEVLSEKYDIFYVKNKNKKVLFKNIDCWLNSSLWIKLSRYKKLTYFMLWWNWIKVPNSIVTNKNYQNLDSLLKEKKIKFPLVVKPCVWSHGDWVSVNIWNYTNLEKAINIALKHDNEILIQEFFKWDDYRILLVNHKIVAAMQRVPAYIVWNWKEDIKILIKKENQNEKRWEWHAKSLSTIIIDAELKRQLEIKWLNINSIPKRNQKIFLRKNANLSTWWVSIDVTDKIHPEIKKMCEKASKILWLKVCWIDYLSEDISKPLSKQKWWIIEVNHTPWLRWHHFPFEWKPRNVAKEILKLALK